MIFTNINPITIIIISACAGSIITSLLFRWSMKRITKKSIEKYIDEQLKK